MTFIDFHRITHITEELRHFPNEADDDMSFFVREITAFNEEGAKLVVKFYVDKAEKAFSRGTK